MKFLFWFSFIILFYVYMGYWLILYVLSKTKKKGHKINKNLEPKIFEPNVSLVIPVHNEEDVIVQKLKNALSLDYPSQKLEIVVASDNSNDKTVEIVKGYITKQLPLVKLFDFKKRRGKMAVLNESVRKLNSDIIVFTDANAMFKKDVIRKLVSHFADEDIGCVCGAKTITRGENIEKCEGIYWRFENSLKLAESEFGSCCGADGSIYAVRRELYPFPRDDRLIMDDFAVSLGIIAGDKRVIFEKEAVSYETPSATSLDEFRRKTRIMVGAIGAIVGVIHELPLHTILFQLISHKILRWAGGLFMVILFISNLFVYHPFLILQIIFYSFALSGFIFETQNSERKTQNYFYVPYYFCLTNIAQIVGLVKYIKGERSPEWGKVERHDVGDIS